MQMDKVLKPDFARNRKLINERKDALELEKLLYEMSQEPPVVNKNIPTTKPLEKVAGEWKRFDNMATLKKLVKNKKKK